MLPAVGRVAAHRGDARIRQRRGSLVWFPHHLIQCWMKRTCLVLSFFTIVSVGSWVLVDVIWDIAKVPMVPMYLRPLILRLGPTTAHHFYLMAYSQVKNIQIQRHVYPSMEQQSRKDGFVVTLWMPKPNDFHNFTKRKLQNFLSQK